MGKNDYPIRFSNSVIISKEVVENTLLETIVIMFSADGMDNNDDLLSYQEAWSLAQKYVFEESFKVSKDAIPGGILLIKRVPSKKNDQ